MRFRLFASVVAATLLVMRPSVTDAHPHAWVDIKVSVAFNAAGEATGLTETWVFDAFYTAYAVIDFDTDGDGTPDPDKLAELLAVNLEALAPFDYFTRVESDDRPVTLGQAVDAASSIENHRLQMTFRVPFAAPVSVDQVPLRYAVFDPTYYVEMLHAEVTNAIQLVDAPTTCSHRLTEPNPEPEQIALAFSIDRTQTAGDGLGEHFAEWVTIRC